MSSGFDRASRVVSGRRLPRETALGYRVLVTDGRLRVRLADRDGSVLEVSVDRLEAHPLGHAGAVVVRVEDAPILVDFTRREHGTGVVGLARRAAYGIRGRRTRRTFLRSLGFAAR